MNAEREHPRLDPLLLDRLRDALLAEIGARSVYPRLARATRDAELARVLGGFHEEESRQVERLCALIRALGGAAGPTSWRRGAGAWAVALGARVGALALCLRLCSESETTVERWYHECALFLAQAGRLDDARVCEELALTKYRHARTLEAWVGH